MDGVIGPTFLSPDIHLFLLYFPMWHLRHPGSTWAPLAQQQGAFSSCPLASPSPPVLSWLLWLLFHWEKKSHQEEKSLISHYKSPHHHLSHFCFQPECWLDFCCTPGISLRTERTDPQTYWQSVPCHRLGKDSTPASDGSALTAPPCSFLQFIQAQGMGSGWGWIGDKPVLTGKGMSPWGVPLYVW